MDNFSLTGQPLINEFNPVVDSPASIAVDMRAICAFVDEGSG
jgi:hypothetical protein